MAIAPAPLLQALAGHLAALGMAPGGGAMPDRAADDLAAAAPTDRLPARAVVLGEGGGAPGWARALARAGVDTTLIVPDDDDARRLADMQAQAAARGGQAPGFTLGAEPAMARGAGLLVAPDLAVARLLLPELVPLLAADAVVISAGDLDALLVLSALLPPRARLVGMHLPPPASASGVVEILPAPGSGAAAGPTQEAGSDGASAGAMAMAATLARRMGRLAVCLPPGVASPALALLGRLTETADRLLMSGATPWDLDAAMVAAGWAQGLFLREDQAGIDHMLALRRAHAQAAGRAVLPIAPRMLAEGRMGVKGGVGWYRYPGGGGPVVDPLMEDMCTEEAHFARWPRAVPDVAEMQARLALAVMDSAAALLGRLAPSTLDCIAVHVLGFPASTGGPLRLVMALGARLDAPLAALAGESPDPWAGAPARVAHARAVMGGTGQPANGSCS
ncbi:MAG: 3-hydroxyacyl-CoA dehydrogenase family protein [Pararhodobacter sp.]